MAVTIKLNLEGYYTEEMLPPEQHQCGGVYIIYKGKPTAPGKCTLTKLLYIGRSGDTANRFTKSHHKYQECHNSLAIGEKLYFYFANVDDEERAEKALVYHLKPPYNEQLKDNLKCPTTTVIVSGKKIFESFTVWES